MVNFVIIGVGDITRKRHIPGILQYVNNVTAIMIASNARFSGEDRSTVLIGTEGTITTYAGAHELVVEKKNREKYFSFVLTKEFSGCMIPLS